MKAIHVLFLLLAALMVSGCTKSVKANSFFDRCENLAIEFKKIQDIPLKITKEKAVIGDEKFNFDKYDYSKRADYIITNYSKITGMIEGIHPTTADSKENLADDAELIQIISYLAISYPNASSIDLFEKRAQDFINSERIIVLDSRTIKQFTDITTFKFFIDPELWSQSKQSIVADLIKDNNYRSILIQAIIKIVYLDKAKFQEARSYLTRYANELEHEHRTYIDNLIAETQKQYEEYKK